MRHGLFTPHSFDALSLFQVFDHLPDPGNVLDEAARILKPGGALLILNHNVEALSARVLGERSPIIDIEHTYLYSPTTLSALLWKHGFMALEKGTVWNRLTIRYLVHLLPLPPRTKEHLLRALDVLHAVNVPVMAPLGNLYVIARSSGRGNPTRA